MRITSKGQVTIPQAVREAAGLLPNTEVEIEIDGKQVVLRPAPDAPGRGDRLVEHLRSLRPRFSMSTEEIMGLTRGDDARGGG